MKKVHIVLVHLATAICILSCHKDIDLSNTKSEVQGTPLPGQITYCRIESIWQKQLGTIDERYHLILYDEFENPVAITFPVVITGSPYLVFKYDQWHRLKEYLGIYSNGSGYEFRHLYGYDLHGRIGVDTMYVLGNLATGYFDHRQISEIQYDNQNRISKIHSVINIPNVSFEQDFNYDNAGNLVKPGISYDSKTSILRTNDIWMFLARDYSVNNAFIAQEYNAMGFPTKIHVRNSLSFIGASIFLDNSEISYGCRQAYW
jgi:hypothetical protein